MRTQKHNERTFSFSFNGNNYLITAYSKPGKEICECRELDLKGIYNFGNRPWQSFDYSIALSTLADKAKKKYGAELANAITELHDRIGKGEEERAEQMFQSFKSAYDNCSDKTKQMLKESNITINSEKDAQFVTGLMKGLTLIEQAG